MEPLNLSVPAPDEYAPFYAGYVAAVAGRDVALLLRQQPRRLHALCGHLSDEEALARYAPGKWSVKEVVGHMTDAERVFAYRAFRIGRGDATPLPGFEQNDYVAAAHFDRFPLSELLAEFETARAGALPLLRHLSPEHLDRRGLASGMEISVRALLTILAGHAEHHIRILRDRYGLSPLTPPAE